MTLEVLKKRNCWNKTSLNCASVHGCRHIYVYTPLCAGGRAVEDDMGEKDLRSSKEWIMFHQVKLEKEKKKRGFSSVS